MRQIPWCYPRRQSLQKDSFLCDKCETKRVASDLANKTKPKGPFGDLFGNGGLF